MTCTILYFCLENIKSDNKEQILNNELQRVHSWQNANKLSLNVRKTKYMIFRKHINNDKGDLNLQISKNIIQSVNECNFLSLHLNSKLNWDTHVNIIEKRISRAVGIIIKMQLISTKTILLSIYNDLILPHINYCQVLQLYFYHRNKQFDFFSAGYKAHTEPLFKIYNILKLEDVFNHRLLVFYYNLKHNKVLYYLISFLPNTSIARGTLSY